ncbi:MULTISPECIES: ArsO family NAD(P)H-dependent flavin-containing monooxygenase [Prauserella salsuginis group]|uniref:ArsO family NAD(P)H-dependent flavin-containing monooxygenase n=1 Tax=Prauserella salsuginis TaxID=387889 RepID=A0ABW6G7M6_9PSEU|nr:MULTISPECIES: ArsO family NAD(P)H-dependent flavin-containing monooxygenase [Prauserella salsuginis group]MCR3719534.1 putative flavoprotein involved in K+ transport [Prauserella flava]MCR3735452.1 putative flavoprotein involved in K+ transport [Prauserella salsuginis]
MTGTVDVVVVGGGQAGLAAGYFLRRAGLRFVVLDARDEPGGAWRRGWDSLRLFSPAEHNPLPGWWMPRQEGEPFPTATHVAGYLQDYERRYDLPVRRPVRVRGVHDAGARLAVDTDHGIWHASFVISATGTWDSPILPHYPGAAEFVGEQLHTVDYRSPERFRGRRVVVVGGGNSAAQILAEVSTVATTTWVTRREPRFMPDDVDGRVLFDVATRRDAARRAGTDAESVSALGDIVMVPPVLEARDRGVCRARPMFDRLTRDGVAWDDGTEQPCDVIVWCTGFRPALDHLEPLELPLPGGVPKTIGTRSVDEPRLYLLGYGDWTGPASATLIGASRTAKPAVADITERLRVA